MAPILKPLADQIGMNDIQFCIMMITALGVGFITPPLGLNLFVVSGLTGEFHTQDRISSCSFCLLYAYCHFDDCLLTHNLNCFLKHCLKVKIAKCRPNI